MKGLRTTRHFAGDILTGKQGIKGEHRALVLETGAHRVVASIDFEASVQGVQPQLKRWDYFLETSDGIGSMHALEVHEFDQKALHGKKTGTLELLQETCPDAIADIRTWNVAVKGNLPRQDLIARFTADTKIRIRRNLVVKGL